MSLMNAATFCLKTLIREIDCRYDDSWGDLLTEYDGDTITYDTIGNPFGRILKSIL